MPLAFDFGFIRQTAVRFLIINTPLGAMDLKETSIWGRRRNDLTVAPMGASDTFQEEPRLYSLHGYVKLL